MAQPVKKEKKVEPKWSDLMFWESEHWENVRKVIEAEENLIPPLSKVFRPLMLCPISKVKVLILVDRPTCYSRYELDGIPLSITTKEPERIGSLPLTTRRMLEGVKNYTKEPIGTANLSKWFDSGVMLWHATPTTIKGNGTNPHSDIGWNYLTVEIIQKLNQEVDDLLIIYEKDLEDILIEATLNTEIKESTIAYELPGGSWYSQEASDGEVFRKINSFLLRKNKAPIDFTLR